MKKVLFFIAAAVILAGLFGGMYTWKKQLWVFAPKESEVEETIGEIDIPVETDSENL